MIRLEKTVDDYQAISADTTLDEGELVRTKHFPVDTDSAAVAVTLPSPSRYFKRVEMIFTNEGASGNDLTISCTDGFVNDGDSAVISDGKSTRMCCSKDSDGAWRWLVFDDTYTWATEATQDLVGAMFSSNTETGIAATYQDGDGTIDLVVAFEADPPENIGTAAAGTADEAARGDHVHAMPNIDLAGDVVEWAAWDVSSLLTWGTADPTGLTLVGRKRQVGEKIEVMVDIVGTDGNDSDSLTITPPVDEEPDDLDIYIPFSVYLDVAGTPDTDIYAYIDATQATAANRVLTIGGFTLTDGSAFRISIYACWEFTPV